MPQCIYCHRFICNSSLQLVRPSYGVFQPSYKMRCRIIPSVPQWRLLQLHFHCQAHYSILLQNFVSALQRPWLCSHCERIEFSSSLYLVSSFCNQNHLVFFLKTVLHRWVRSPKVVKKIKWKEPRKDHEPKAEVRGANLKVLAWVVKQSRIGVCSWIMMVMVMIRSYEYCKVSFKAHTHFLKKKFNLLTY